MQDKPPEEGWLDNFTYSSDNPSYDAMNLKHLETLKESIKMNGTLILLSALEPFVLLENSPVKLNGDMKLILQSVIRNISKLDSESFGVVYFDNDSKKSPNPLYVISKYFTSFVKNNILVFQTCFSDVPSSVKDINLYYCESWLLMLLDSFGYKDILNPANPINEHVDGRYINEVKSPNFCVCVVSILWLLGRCEEAKALIIQYLLYVSSCVPTSAASLSSSAYMRDGGDAEVLEYGKSMKCSKKSLNQTYFGIAANLLQYFLAVGRLVEVRSSEEWVKEASKYRFVKRHIAKSGAFEGFFVQILAVKIRVFLAIACLDHRYDVIKVILDHGLADIRDDTERLRDELGELSSDTFRLNFDTISRLVVGKRAIIQQNWSFLISAQDNLQFYKSILTDKGFLFYESFTKDEATEYLKTKPPGAFLLRPHSTTPQLAMYVSFKASPDVSNTWVDAREKSNGAIDPSVEPSVSSQDLPSLASTPVPEEREIEGTVKHAVVRWESVSTNVGKKGLKLGKIQYRCGSVGPRDTLFELLREISDALPNDTLDFSLNRESIRTLYNTVCKGGDTESLPDIHCAPDLSHVFPDPNKNLWANLRVVQKRPLKSASCLWFMDPSYMPLAIVDTLKAIAGVDVGEMIGHESSKTRDYSRIQIEELTFITRAVVHGLVIRDIHKQASEYLTSPIMFPSSIQSEHTGFQTSRYFYFSVLKNFHDVLLSMHHINLNKLLSKDVTEQSLEYTRLFCSGVVEWSDEEPSDAPSDGPFADINKILVEKRKNRFSDWCILMEKYAISTYLHSLMGFYNQTQNRVVKLLTRVRCNFGGLLPGSPVKKASVLSGNAAHDHTSHELQQFLSEEELGECLVGILFEKLSCKPVKFSPNNVAHRTDITAMVNGILLADVYQLIDLNNNPNGLDSPTRLKALSASQESWVSPELSEILKLCSKFVFAFDADIFSSSHAPEDSKYGSYATKDSLSDSSKSPGLSPLTIEVVCSAEMVVHWLERKLGVVATVIKPSDAFNSSIKYLRYIEPWAVSPIINQGSHHYSTSFAKGSLWNKIAMGRSFYTPRSKLPTSAFIPVSAVNSNDDGQTATTPLTKVKRGGFFAKSVEKSAIPMKITPQTRVANIAEVVIAGLLCGGISSWVDENIASYPVLSPMVQGLSGGGVGMSSHASWSSLSGMSISSMNVEASSPRGRRDRTSNRLLAAVRERSASRLKVTKDVHEAYFLFTDIHSRETDVDCESPAASNDGLCEEAFEGCDPGIVALSHWFLVVWYAVQADKWVENLVNSQISVDVFNTSDSMNQLMKASSNDLDALPKITESEELKIDTSYLASCYRLSLEAQLLRNFVYYQLSIPHRYVVKVDISLKGLKDASYRSSKDIFGSAAKEMEVYAVIRLLPTSKVGGSVESLRRIDNTTDVRKASFSTSHGIDHISASPPPKSVRSRAGTPSLSAPSSPVPHGIVDSKHSIDAYVTPDRKAVAMLDKNAHASGAIEFSWNEHATVKFPLPHSASLRAASQFCNPPIAPVCSAVLDPTRVAHLHEPPSVVHISVYEKSVGFFGVIGNMNDKKLGELNLHIDENTCFGRTNSKPNSTKISDDNVWRDKNADTSDLTCINALTFHDWLPILNPTDPTNTAVWLLNIQLDIEYELMDLSD